MRHPTEGVIRRLIDEPVAVAAADREHVAGCQLCLRGVVAAREDARLLEAALSPESAADVDVTAAWRRFSAAGPATEPKPVGASPRAHRARALWRRPVVAVAAFAVVIGGAGTAAANDWLQVFRTEKIAPVGFSTTDLISLPDLSAYGDVELTGESDFRDVVDAATAAAETGLAVPAVADLPNGIGGEPRYQVGGEITATFTFSAERAAAAAAETGATLPPVPPGLDGSQLRLVAGPGVAQIWESAADVPALVVGRAVAPTAFSSGVPFETARDYVLSLPGLPADIAAQLRTFTSDGSTLPLPVPTDEVTTTSVDVNGQPATLLATRDRTVAAVVWVTDGVVTAVAGSLDADEVLAIAGDLR